MNTTANEQALLVAASTGHLPEVRRLVNEGVDIDCRDVDQWTPLHKAAHGGHADVVRFLLLGGANAWTLMPNGQTLLASVIQHDQFAIAAILYPILYPGSNTASVDNLVLECELSRRPVNSVLKATYHDKSVVAKGPQVPTKRNIQMLREEASAMQTVASPYILPLLAVLDNGSREPVLRDLGLQLYSPAMITEYMDQGDLHAYLEAKRLGQPVALDVSTVDVALVLAHALADLHRQNIIHRDVKSLNIYLSTTHYIRLGNLASSRPMDGDVMTSNVGTQFWMAPEVFRVGLGGDGQTYTSAADIYSFGVVLTELDTLCLPYDDESDRNSIAERVRTGQLRPRMSATCPQWLQDLANQCLSFNPTDRPTANDIIKVLLAHRNDDDRVPNDQGNVIHEIYAAVRNEDLATLQRLLAQGVDPNVQDDAGLPLLHVAVDIHSTELLAVLLASAKFPINGLDICQSTPLDRAIRNQDVDTALVLVLANATVQSVSQDALCTFVQTFGAHAFGAALLRAASEGDASSVDRLLRAGAQLTTMNTSGNTTVGPSLPSIDADVTKALVSAVLRGHIDAVQCLLDLGADVSTILPNGQTLLAAAVQRGHYEVATIVFRWLYPGGSVLVSAEGLRVGTELRKTFSTLVATATLHDKPVVIKGPNGHQQWARDRMLQEVAVMQAVSSPYLQPLIAVLDTGSGEPHLVEQQHTGGRRRNLYSPTMIMEDMDQGDLYEYLKSKRISEPLVMDVSTLDVALVLAHALADLHKRNIIHHDVKSQNIFLSTTHYIRLGDVGLARTGHETMTASVGTALWMAPEVLCADNGEEGEVVTIAADIYSFGVVLTELDTLNVPYADVADRDTIMDKVRNGQLRPHMSETCPQWLNDLANQCLSFDPKDRPTAETIVATLLPHRETTAFDL